MMVHRDNGMTELNAILWRCLHDFHSFVFNKAMYSLFLCVSLRESSKLSQHPYYSKFLKKSFLCLRNKVKLT